MTGLPSGTDIEGSRKFAHKHSETWESTQNRHHALSHEAIESNNGFVFRTLGDTFMRHSKRWDALKAALDAF